MKDFISANRFMGAINKRDIIKEKFEQQLKNYSPRPNKEIGKQCQQKSGIKNDIAFTFTFAMNLWNEFLCKRIPGLRYNLLFKPITSSHHL
jgi:hypothetical protein